MIRNAEPGDIPAIAELGALFHIEAELGDVVGYCPESTAKTLQSLIDSPDGILLVAEQGGEIVGMTGGLAFPFYFNHAHKSGQELFWFVKPEARNGVGRLLFDAIEAEAKAAGCVSWAMIALDRVQPELTGKIYRRRGYRASEHSYIKRL